MILQTHAGILYQNTTPFTLLDVDFNSSMTSLPSSLTGVSATFTRASTRYRREGNILVSKSSNVFFTEQDPTTSKYGYTPEPAATNYITKAVDIQAPWGFYSMNAGYDAGTDPINSAGADYLNSFAVNGNSYIQHTATAQNAISTVSFYYKYTGLAGLGLTAWPHWCLTISNGTNSTNQWINAQTNTLGTYNNTGGAGTPTFYSSTIERLGTSDWYRVSLTYTPNTSTHYVQLFCAENNGVKTRTIANAQRNLWAWGWQLESGYNASSLIITTGATATRAADVLSVATSNIQYANAATIALMSDFRKKIISGSNEHLMFINDGSATNQAGLTLKSNDTARITTNSTNIDGATTLGTTERKFAASFKNGSKLRSLGGSTLLADTSTTMPAGVSSLNIGHSLGSSQPSAYIFGCKYYTTTRTQAQLNTLTT